MHIPWSDVELLLAIAETGSLSGAARALRTTQPTVSRRLADLEAELGEPLFQRTVAGAAPTSFGERLLEPARRMGEHAREVQRAAEDADKQPGGVVRVSAAPGMAFAFVAPCAGLLRKQLPGVRLEVIAATRYVDLVRREADVAIRWQSPARRDQQRELEVLAAVEHPVVGLATRAYRATLPKRYTLRDVRWVGWAPPFDQLAPNPQLAAAIPGFQLAFAADDYLVQLRAAEAGAGAIVSPRMRHRLSPPTPLVELSVSLAAPTLKTHVVAARSALTVPRIRAVAELLAREFLTTQRRAG
jgi:DNA-binding transcriptional LysR family regulator